MIYVLTGGSSFIGSALAKCLLDNGESVICICRKTSNREHIPVNPNLRIVNADMHEISNISKEIEHADVFFHLAWGGVSHEGRNDKNLQQDNFDCSLTAAKVAAEIGCKLFVLSGSQAEYGFIRGIFNEDSECHPENEYGRYKLLLGDRLAEECPQMGVKFIHLRIVSIYGEYDKAWTMIISVLKKMLNNEDVELSDCTQMWNFVYIRDAVKQMYLLCRNALENNKFKSERYLIGSKDTRPLKSFIEDMNRLTNSHSKLMYGYYKPMNTVELQPDISKTENAINFISDYTFEEGIKNIINTLKNESF